MRTGRSAARQWRHGQSVQCSGENLSNNRACVRYAEACYSYSGVQASKRRHKKNLSNRFGDVSWQEYARRDPRTVAFLHSSNGPRNSSKGLNVSEKSACRGKGRRLHAIRRTWQSTRPGTQNTFASLYTHKKSHRVSFTTRAPLAMSGSDSPTFFHGQPWSSWIERIGRDKPLSKCAAIIIKKLVRSFAVAGPNATTASVQLQST